MSYSQIEKVDISLCLCEILISSMTMASHTKNGKAAFSEFTKVSSKLGYMWLGQHEQS